MARLIDADALHGKVKMETNPYGKPTIDYDSGVKVLEWIDKAPTIDAVLIVRCKDCTVPHNKYTGCPELNGLVTPPDFYCPFGERKDGDDNG